MTPIVHQHPGRNGKTEAPKRPTFGTLVCAHHNSPLKTVYQGVLQQFCIAERKQENKQYQLKK